MPASARNRPQRRLLGIGKEGAMEVDVVQSAAILALSLTAIANAVDLHMTYRRVAELEKAVEKAEDAAYRRGRGDDGLHR